MKYRIPFWVGGEEKKYTLNTGLFIQARYTERADRIATSWLSHADRKRVKLEMLPDESFSLAELKGDGFTPEVNSDVDPVVLRKQEKAYEQRVRRTGVWGIRSSYWTGRQWQAVDQIWGFVGKDWQGSGYDLDLMEAAIEAYRKQAVCSCCGDPVLETE